MWLYQFDGKHFTAREVVDGKSKELQKLPFNGSPEDLTAVEISLEAKLCGYTAEIRGRNVAGYGARSPVRAAISRWAKSVCSWRGMTR